MDIFTLKRWLYSVFFTSLTYSENCYLIVTCWYALLEIPWLVISHPTEKGLHALCSSGNLVTLYTLLRVVVPGLWEESLETRCDAFNKEDKLPEIGFSSCIVHEICSRACSEGHHLPASLVFFLCIALYYIAIDGIISHSFRNWHVGFHLAWSAESCIWWATDLTFTKDL